MHATLQLFKALGDEMRLRIVAVLSVEPLSVNELLEIVEAGQSRVSRHLRILAEAKILEYRREGSRVYYGLHHSLRQNRLAGAIGRELGFFDRQPQGEFLPPLWLKDRDRLYALLEKRRESMLDFFQSRDDSLPATGSEKELIDADFYRRAIVEQLPERCGTLVDLGCGRGELAALMVNRCSRLIVVDQSRTMLNIAQQRVPQAEGRLGDVSHLPLLTDEVDVAVAAMLLHHLPDPLPALQEMARILRPGGRLLLAELQAHKEERMRQIGADFWLGFEKQRLGELLALAGFRIDENRRGRGRGQIGQFVIVATLLEVAALSR